MNDSGYETIKTIEKLLEYLTYNSNIRLNFHDIYGITRFNKELHKVLDKYCFHNNPFCDCVKKTTKGLGRCINAKNCAVKKFEKEKQPYFGYCYMGLGEYVYPLFFKDKLVAVLFVGEFLKDSEVQTAKLKTGAKELGLDFEPTKNLFDNVVTDVNKYDIEEKIIILIKLFQLFLYESGYKLTDVLYENHIAEQAVSFISANSANQLSLDLIADHCHCNSTYLSRVFKQSTGTNISEYINHVRIEKAKVALQFTEQSVTDIGYDVGFSDTAYFSKVFKKVTGVTPKEYRKNFDGNK